MIVLAGDGAQMEFAWPYCASFVHTKSGDGPVYSTFRVSWLRRQAMLHHSGCPIIFRVHKHNEEELLCTFSFKNNASTGKKSEGGSGEGDRPCKA